jgi:hypothetical protein
MRRSPKVLARRPSLTFSLRAHNDERAAELLLDLIVEEMDHGVTSDQLPVRPERGT